MRNAGIVILIIVCLVFGGLAGHAWGWSDAEQHYREEVGDRFVIDSYEITDIYQRLSEIEVGAGSASKWDKEEIFFQVNSILDIIGYLPTVSDVMLEAAPENQ